MSEECDVETVGALLEDPTARTILVETSREPMSASTLSEHCDVSRPTVYRRLEDLRACDLLEERTRPDPDAGAIHPDQQVPDTGPHYMVPYAERVAESGVPVGAVGRTTTAQGADAVVRNGRADLAVVGREHLRDPYFAIRAARELGREAPVPRQYYRGFN